MKKILFYILIGPFIICANRSINDNNIVFSNSILTINDTIIDNKTPIDKIIVFFGKPDTVYTSLSQFIRYIDPGHDTLRTKCKTYDFTTKGIKIECDTANSGYTKNSISKIITLKLNERHHRNFMGKVSIEGVAVDSSFNKNKAKQLFGYWSFSADSLFCYKSDNINFPFCNYCSIKFSKRKKIIEAVYFVLN